LKQVHGFSGIKGAMRNLRGRQFTDPANFEEQSALARFSTYRVSTELPDVCFLPFALRGIWERELKFLRTKGNCRLKTKRAYPLMAKGVCPPSVEIDLRQKMNSDPLQRVGRSGPPRIIGNPPAATSVRKPFCPWKHF